MRNPLRILALSTIAAVLVVTAIAEPANATGEHHQSRDRIAYTTSIPGGGAHVVVANPDGTGTVQLQLPQVLEDFGRPVWSHDASKLLLSNILRADSTGNLLPFRPATVSPDGRHFRLFALPAQPPDMYCSAWTPDDSRFVCAVGGDTPGIFTFRATDGGDPLRLTTNPFANPDTPVGYSPDGNRFAFLRTKPTNVPDTTAVALFIARRDGSHPTQVTPYGVLMPDVIQSAAWSPDGRSLLSSTTDGHLVRINAHSYGISQIRLDVPEPYFASVPSPSPDGRSIVFSLSHGAGPRAADILTARADGSHVNYVTTTDDVAEWYPEWANTSADLR
ncbi:TolB family protein [Diaminobutyricibacter sp. McL0618]|uniref:TolB family protein n=1 Tax=Leifsonia sp. McL0618 TaxID=3415677 RepID=UPI003CF29F3D